jgi:secreted PhoX family phosphatase
MDDAETYSKSGITRRDAIRAGAGAAGGIAFFGGLLGPALTTMAAPAVVGAGPYGPLNPPDSNGIMLPDGFTSKQIAFSGQKIGPNGYKFHGLPDGMGTYRTRDGGFILVSNSELPNNPSSSWDIGAGAIRFDRNFRVVDAYPILKFTAVNCAGGVTPWGTWLSCEEIDRGKVFECDPWGEKPSQVRPAMGVFKHEAAVVDPVGKHAFLTEDLGDGCFYRFRPDNYPDLSSGKLDAAVVDIDGKVTWTEVPDPQWTGPTPTRQQVPGATQFRRGEGAWYDDGIVYFATTQDDRVYAYTCATEELEVLYDGQALGEDAPLTNTDNVTVSPVSGDLFVCEDGGDLQVCLISTEGEAAPFLELPGAEHLNSELTGPVFDPTGSRFYFSSQRVARSGLPFWTGAIYEISGPFRRTRPEPFPDKAGPVARIRVLGAPSLRGLVKAGQTFGISVSDQSPPVKLDIQLITRLRRSAGKGSRDATIGRARLVVDGAGERRIKIRPAAGYRQKLRRRDVARARLVVVATDAKGNRKKTVKPVRFG